VCVRIELERKKLLVMASKGIRLSRNMIKKLMSTEPLSSYALLKVAGADVKRIFSGIHAITKTPIRKDGPKRKFYSTTTIPCLSLETPSGSDHSNVKQMFQSKLIESMKAKDKVRTTVIRSILSELVYAEKSKSSSTQELSYTDTLEILTKMVAKRKESIEQFRAGHREDLVTIEEAELRILMSFLPETWSEEQIEQAIKDNLMMYFIDPTCSTTIRPNLGDILRFLYDPTNPNKLDVSRAPRKIVVDILKRSDLFSTRIHSPPIKVEN
jgi:uncharacterized protein